MQVDVGPGIHGELFQTQGDALVGFVDFQHHRFDVLALLEHFGRVIDLAGPGDVGHMNHAIQAIFQFDEGAVAGEVADLALNPGVLRIFLRRLVPRIGFELADAERDLLFFAIDTQNDRLDFLSGLSTSAGLAMRLIQDNSVTCTKPSTPGSSSTNAP